MIVQRKELKVLTLKEEVGLLQFLESSSKRKTAEQFGVYMTTTCNIQKRKWVLGEMIRKTEIYSGNAGKTPLDEVSDARWMIVFVGFSRCKLWFCRCKVWFSRCKAISATKIARHKGHLFWPATFFFPTTYAVQHCKEEDYAVFLLSLADWSREQTLTT